MAVDPSDLIGTPFNFGECYEGYTSCNIHCDAWKEEDTFIDVLLRKEGDFLEIHIPEFLQETKNSGVLTSDCDIILDLSFPLKDSYTEFAVEKSTSRHFVGSMQIYDEKDECEKVVFASVDFDQDTGIFTFEPVTNFAMHAQSVPSVEPCEVGLIQCTLTIDTEEENTIIEEESDVDMDYEDEREKEYGGSITTNSTAICNAWQESKQEVFIKARSVFEENKYTVTVTLPEMLYEAKVINDESEVKDTITITCKELEDHLKKCGIGKLATCKGMNAVGDYANGIEEVDCEIINNNGKIVIRPEGNYFHSYADMPGKIGIQNTSFQFEYNENEAKYEQKEIEITAHSKAWKKEDQTVRITFCKSTNTELNQLFIPSILFEVNSETDKGYPITIDVTEEHFKYLNKGIKQGKLGMCSVVTFLPSNTNTDMNFVQVAGEIYFYKKSGLQIYVKYSDYQHFYGTKDAGVSPRLIGLSELFTCTFSGPETEEAAKECSLPQEVDPPETPSELNRMTFSAVIHCDAWETPAQHRTVTFEKNGTAGTIYINDLLSNVSYTTNEGSAIYANCESQIVEFFKGYLPSGVITSIGGVGTMYCPKIYSSNDNYKDNVDVKVYYYDGKLMIVPNNYGSYHWFYGIKDEDEEVNVKEIGVKGNVSIRFTIQEEEPTYTDINADYPKILDKSTLPGVYSDTRSLMVQCPCWNILSSDPNYYDRFTCFENIKFERDDTLGVITLPSLLHSSVQVTDNTAIEILDTEGYDEKFYGVSGMGILNTISVCSVVPSKNDKKDWGNEVRNLTGQVSWYQGQNIRIHIVDESVPKQHAFFGSKGGGVVGTNAVYKITFNIPSSSSSDPDPLPFTQNVGDLF